MPQPLSIEPATGKSGRTLESILLAALHCYERFGLEQTSLEQVAEQAGMSRATVYRHAKNRRELLNKVFIRDAQKALEALSEAMQQYEKLPDIVMESTLFLNRRRHHADVQNLLDKQSGQIIESHGMPVELLRLFAEKTLREPYQKACANNELPDGLTLDMLTDWLGRMMRSLLLEPPEFSRDEAAMRQYLRMVLLPIFNKH